MTSSEKRVSALPDHALVNFWGAFFQRTGTHFARKRYTLPSQNHGRGRSLARQPHRIKEAGALGKQEGGFTGVFEPIQPIDIPVKSATAPVWTY